MDLALDDHIVLFSDTLEDWLPSVDQTKHVKNSKEKRIKD